ncbi:MAG: AMP-binding protein [Cyclobacteriaceae bacterium]|nr:AMP-binding protein [Cyclobacteriaceae bacterium]
MEKFIWTQRYPEGISATVDISTHSSLTSLIDENLIKYKERDAFENFGKTITFGELDRLSRNFGAYLQQELGLQKGDRIAIDMPNLLQYPIALVGALRAGLIVVNTNPLYTPREMEHQFKDSGVKAVVIVQNFASNLQQIIGNTEIKHVILTQLGDMVGGLKGSIINFVVKRIKKMVPSFSLPDAISFKNALKKGANLTLHEPEITPEDLAFLQYTGGTTGISKGAQLSHGNLVAHTAILSEWFKPWMDPSKQETMITALPLYHIFALTVNGIHGINEGMKNVLITNPRDMPGFIKELMKHKMSLITGVNTLFNGLLNQPDFKSVDFSNLKGALGGGMAVQDFVARKWNEVTGTPLIEGYGLSETSPVLCANPMDGTHKIGSIGLPLSNTEVGIFDDDGNKLAQGEVGEICARGPQVMKGYWQRDNDGVFYDGGWFRTGDIGLMDEDGFFKIVDRKKDMILVSGFNVYPNEVENVVADHPKVLEVAAIGVPHEKSVECVKIFVVKGDESLTEDELFAYCEKNLTGYKQPKYIEFRKELPKTNVGKILRRKLKEEEESK